MGKQLYYKNIFNNKKINGSASSGTADPFIFKYNGYYYLLCTKPKHLILMKSFDLIKWELVNGDGIIANDSFLYHAYAPEITYYNGYFYIVTSPCGNGHHIYRSTRIDGPFEHYLGNFEELIDGSFFNDNDGKKYFLRASETGITIKRFKEHDQKSDFDLFDEYYNFKNSIIGNWTEGPFLLKRYGYYYLTFTGTHFLSDAYRVDYASGKKLTANGLSFKDTILLSTSDEFYGLGHSMTFLGPDLDSYYIAYHNMMNNHKRYLNISRLMFDNHGKMIVNGVKIKQNFLFERPVFEHFCSQSSYLSDRPIESNCFSVEYNFIGKNAKLIVAYKNDQDYCYIKLEEQKIFIYQFQKGLTNIIASIDLNVRLHLDVYHCLRLQYNRGKVALYLDQIEFLIQNIVPISTGLVGYLDNELCNAYLAFSNYAFGQKDKKDVKDHRFFLDNCLLIKKGLSTEFFINETGEYQIFIASKDYFEIKQMLIDGKKIVLNDIKHCSDNTYLASAYLTKGIHTFLVDGLSSKDKIISFIKSDHNNALNNSSFINESVVYGRYINVANGIYFENDRNAILSKKEYFTYTAQVNVKLVGEPIKNDTFVGLLADISNYSKSNQFENAFSMQGYMFVINRKKVFIIEANYNHSKILKTISHIEAESEFTLKIIKDISSISFYINNIEVFNLSNSNRFIKGHIGLYNNHASAIFNDYFINNEEEL